MDLADKRHQKAPGAQVNETLNIQVALANAGFNPGPIDGIRGRRTIAAVKSFQAAHGLMQDGIVGPLTSKLLFGATGNKTSAADKFPWYAEAARLMGTEEHVGKGSNQTILDWAKAHNLLDYRDDDIPWCGLFVAHCIGSQLPDEPLPPNVLSARAWTGFGRKVTPREAAVLVFWRGSPSGWQGHVGFYASEDKEAYHVLGGNQGNRVSIARVAKTRLLGAYWPLTFPDAGTGVVRHTSNPATLSTNEQ